MTLEVDTVKGFRDYLPPESLKREAVKKIIEKWFKLYGFLPIETPLIEFDELMKSENANDEAVSDRFRLKDRGERNLGLRYEFTFQLARILKQNPNMKLPFKRYQIGEVFRDEPIAKNRFRQFTQCDVDTVGNSSVSADAECLAVFSNILKELKVKFEIEVNNRKLLNAVIESVGISEKSDREKIMRELDKLEKIGLDQLKFNLRDYADVNQVITLLKLLEKDFDFFKENMFAGIEELEDLFDYCEQYGVELKFNPFLARGLGYYTGNIFEIRSAEKISIAAGGRYDKTVGKYLWKDIPAVGISFGLERLTEAARVNEETYPKVEIISISQDFEAIKLARKLRKEGISCIVEFEKIGKALEYADAWKIPFVIFVGEEEVGKKKYKLKEMKSGNESLLSEAQLIKKLK